MPKGRLMSSTQDRQGGKNALPPERWRGWALLELPDVLAFYIDKVNFFFSLFC